MFPYYGYSAPSYSVPSDSEYLRALAEERAAREQYAAARRAQEEARARAARARAARRAYASPYNSYHDDDYLDSYNDLDLGLEPLDDALGSYYPGPSSARSRPLSYMDGQRPYGFGLDPYSQRAMLEEQRRRHLMEEQRRRELLELEREKERRRLEEERIRRILQEERMREEAARQKLLEEERMRKALEEERIRRALLEEEEARRERERERARIREQQQQKPIDPLDILRALGLAPPASVGESEKERLGRQGARTTQPGRRTGTTPSPVRPFPFGQTPKTTTTQRQRAPSPNPVKKTPSSQSTSIPITSPKSSAKRVPTPSPAQPPTPEQLAAAEKIRDAYRARVSRRAALASIAAIRKRFLAARNGFTLPSTLDYDIPTNGRVPTTVSLGADTSVEKLARLAEDDEADVLEGAPRLAYSPTNAPLHGYEEELNRILGQLDAVESRGDQGVRAARRELARAVEREAERVERWRGVVWRWWTEDQPKEAAAPAESQQMEVEPVESVQTSAEVAQVPQGETSESAATETPMEVEPTTEPPQPVSDSSAATAVPPSPSNGTNSTSFSVPISSPTPQAVEPVESAPTPEIEITDANDAEAPSQPEAEPADIDVPVAEAASSPESAPSQHAQSDNTASESAATEERARSLTPELSHEHSEAEEMEVEPQEVHTPPPAEHTPLVSVDASLPETMDLAHEQQKQPTSEANPIEAQQQQVA
ncbi:hypothetical protein BD310DRAFT_884826 [Dichomitus squalens]|uniref:BAG domain-containing protein n=1 Tax=Dichomitus squalens TaxID=114155 RepID=A0A4Q9PLP7_9APHY|nr:hypothetical protein BD310DRAFT_884826 [Dichomitus squalens]